MAFQQILPLMTVGDGRIRNANPCGVVSKTNDKGIGFGDFKGLNGMSVLTHQGFRDLTQMRIAKNQYGLVGWQGKLSTSPCSTVAGRRGRSKVQQLLAKVLVGFASTLILKDKWGRIGVLQAVHFGNATKMKMVVGYFRHYLRLGDSGNPGGVFYSVRSLSILQEISTQVAKVFRRVPDADNGKRESEPDQRIEMYSRCFFCFRTR